VSARDFSTRRPIVVLRAVIRGVVAIPMAPLLLAAALRARLDGGRTRRRAARPRLAWGPVPILSIKYWSAALRERGYETRTCVTGHYAIHERADFDLYYDELLPHGLAFDPLRGYAAFLWMLRAADVYLCFFDGGFLRGTALRRLELPLLRLAGKRIIVSPYGSDIAVPGHLGIAERSLLEDYPEIAVSGAKVKRRVDHFARWANLIVRNYQYGYLPRWDVLWPTQIAIDAERWRPEAAPGGADGHDGEVVVVHAPNHRNIKGTDSLIEVVEELRGEGLQVRLDLLERRPNTEVRAAVLRSDIVAEQFIAGYALFAIEGMAAARPVLSALGWMPAEVRENLTRRKLPIVDADLTTLKVILRKLVEDPRRRQTLGEAGRRFVVEHHSYEAVGSVWEAIIEHVWSGMPLPDEVTAPAGC
jgi:glycosyltransferase involved in cell wall biosynthesis